MLNIMLESIFAEVYLHANLKILSGQTSQTNNIS